MHVSKSRRNIQSFLLLLFLNSFAARSPYDAPIGDVHVKDVRHMCRRSCRKGSRDFCANTEHAYCTCPEESASGDLYDNMLHFTLPKFACMKTQDHGLATSVTERPLGQCAVAYFDWVSEQPRSRYYKPSSNHAWPVPACRLLWVAFPAKTLCIAWRKVV